MEPFVKSEIKNEIGTIYIFSILTIFNFLKNSVNLVMRKSKVRIKRNLAIPGEPMLQEEFVALIKEAEKGPFKSMDNFTEDILALWKKKYGK